MRSTAWSPGTCCRIGTPRRSAAARDAASWRPSRKAVAVARAFGRTSRDRGHRTRPGRVPREPHLSGLRRGDPGRPVCGRRLGDRILKGDLASPFGLRDVYRPGWAGLPSRAAAAAAVAVLLDLDRLRVEAIGTGPSGGRPTARYHVNPKIGAAAERSGPPPQPPHLVRRRGSVERENRFWRFCRQRSWRVGTAKIIQRSCRKLAQPARPVSFVLGGIFGARSEPS